MHPFRPALYQGRNQRGEYFEGWYFKQSDSRASTTLAVIPGISLGQDRHCFVQAINGSTGESWYERFDLEDFKAENHPFCVQIGLNRFSLSEIHLELEKPQIFGDLRYGETLAYPWRPWAPGIMGPYSFVPSMECYHGVVSLDHQVNGTIHIAGYPLQFQNARGYIEKDWGRSFPESWIWIQGSIFEMPNSSLMFSVARVPWRGKFFTGFLGYLLMEKRIYRFNTYGGSKLFLDHFSEKELKLRVKKGSLQLTLDIHQHNTGSLKAPDKGKMERLIKESVDSRIDYLLEKRGKSLHQGTIHHCGTEICGDVPGLF